jgi:hypothetical protein
MSIVHDAPKTSGSHEAEASDSNHGSVTLPAPSTPDPRSPEGETAGLLGFRGNPPDPQPIRDECLPVVSLGPELIPEPFRGWLADIAERMNVPLEFPSVGAIVALGSLVGRQVAIRPKRFDNWTVVPNLWGGVVGNPGVMKSPALKDAMAPLRRLERRAREQFEEEFLTFQRDEILAKSRAEEAQRALKKGLSDGDHDESLLQQATLAAEAMQISQPNQRRYVLNDPTVEKLGEILAVNPNGVLVFRDELPGLLRGLDKAGRETDRAFYLESWNGTNSFTFDRIARGTKYIEAVCLSILGGIQPGPLADYFKAAAKSGKGDDGLIARFQLLVYPSGLEEWKNVDRWPDEAASDRAFKVFEWLDHVDCQAIEAEPDKYDGPPFLRFSPDAQALFDDWRWGLENSKVLSGNEDPLIQAHLSKYRSLMPKLALLFHLTEAAEGKATGSVSRGAAAMAAGWCDILEGHARRIYAGFGDATINQARRLAAQIKKGKVPDGLAPHQIANRGWTDLGTVADVDVALERLQAAGWVFLEKIRPGTNGGRPKTVIHINPKLLVAA